METINIVVMTIGYLIAFYVLIKTFNYNIFKK